MTIARASDRPSPGPLAIPCVVGTLTLDAMGIGLILPVLPDLIEEVQGRGLGDAALWGGVMAAGYAVMQFLASPAMGHLSDLVGRRPVLLASLGGMALYYVAMALAGAPWVLLLARLFGGTVAATQSTAAALLADLTPDDRRSQNFGLIGAAFGAGFVLGPALGGLLSEFGPRVPFIAAGALAVLNLAVAAFVLPETVTPDRSRRFEPKRANPFGAFRHLGRLPGIRRLVTLVFLYECAFAVYPATWAFYTQERFGWSAATTGLSLAIFGLSLAAVQGGLIRWLLPRLGELRAILLGFLYNTVAFCTVALVDNGAVALVLVSFTALGAIVTPALQGVMSRAVGRDRQGELQGLIGAARAMAMIIAPLVMTSVFYGFVTPPGPYLPGAAFALSAAIMVVCLAVFATRGAASRAMR